MSGRLRSISSMSGIRSCMPYLMFQVITRRGFPDASAFACRDDQLNPMIGPSTKSTQKRGIQINGVSNLQVRNKRTAPGRAHITWGR